MACVKQSYEQYVEGTLIKGITMLQGKGFQYLSFGLIGTSIELLGYFFDGLPLEVEQQAKNRFNNAIDNLFVGIRQEYKRSCPCKSGLHDDHWLYRGLRCGMAHFGRPQGKIVFTTRDEAQKEKNTHLAKDRLGKLVLVAEDLADDFQAAWNALKTRSANGAIDKKVTDDFLAIYSYEGVAQSG